LVEKHEDRAKSRSQKDKDNFVYEKSFPPPKRLESIKQGRYKEPLHHPPVQIHHHQQHPWPTAGWNHHPGSRRQESDRRRRHFNSIRHHKQQVYPPFHTVVRPPSTSTRAQGSRRPPLRHEDKFHTAETFDFPQQTSVVNQYVPGGSFPIFNEDEYEIEYIIDDDRLEDEGDRRQDFNWWMGGQPVRKTQVRTTILFGGCLT